MLGSMEDRLPGGDASNLTSVHLRHARDGEEESLSWLVRHFTPFLRAQAAVRLQGGMRRLYDADDLVDEVWAVVLPRLGDLTPCDGRCTPVLLRFLATTLRNRLNNHRTRYLRAEARHWPLLRADPSASRKSIQEEGPSTTSVVGKVALNEALGALDEALRTLDSSERDVLVLRGIEQHTNLDVARRLGIHPSTATRRYQQVLVKLRARMPGSIFDELPA